MEELFTDGRNGSYRGQSWVTKLSFSLLSSLKVLINYSDAHQKVSFLMTIY